MPTLGIVVPVFNEEAVLSRVYDRLAAVLDSLDIPGSVCFVDDGSRDTTALQLRLFHERDPRFGYIRFSRNFGHQTAVLAGLRELDADVYVVIDGDLQDPPELIPELLARWRAGHEVVYCVRKTRRENPLKQFAYKAFYRLLRSVSYLDIPLDTGDFCLMDRVIVDHLRRMPEHNPFIRGLRTWVGFRQTALYYDRDPRAAGEPKYNLTRLFGLAYDGLVSFSFMPLRFVAKLGFAIAFAAFLGLCALVVTKLTAGIDIAGWTSTIVIVLFMGGVQLLTIGVLGEYLARVFDEVKSRPLYVLQARQLPTGEKPAASSKSGFVPEQAAGSAFACDDAPVETTALEPVGSAAS